MNVTSDYWEHHSQPQKYAELPSAAAWTVYLICLNFGSKMNEKVSHIMNCRCATHEHVLAPTVVKITIAPKLWTVLASHIFPPLPHEYLSGVDLVKKKVWAWSKEVDSLVPRPRGQTTWPGYEARRSEKHLVFYATHVKILVEEWLSCHLPAFQTLTDDQWNNLWIRYSLFQA